MKKLIVVLGIFALVSCSTDDDCKYNEEEVRTKYEEWFKRDITEFERKQMQKEYAEQLEDAC